MTAISFVLVPGYWLGGWAWDQVAAGLRDVGHRVSAVTLPGLGSPTVDRSAVGLAAHVDALGTLVTEVGPEVILVAHSGAGKVVSAVLDRSPEVIRRVVYVDSGPASDGAGEDLAPDVVELPLPSWADLAANGASLEGLTQADLDEFRARAVPHPAGVARDRIRLDNPRRREVATTIVACTIPSGTVAQLAADGHPMFAEVAKLSELTYLDLPTGHWPMWSKPAELTTALIEAAAES